VDDERAIRDILSDFLDLEGFEVRTAASGAEALGLLDAEDFQLVISDLKMPGMGGLELLAAIQQRDLNLLTIIMTGFGTVESAIDAMKKGAWDYILKPFRVEDALHVVRRALEQQRTVAENIRLREAVTLYRISEAMSASLSIDAILDVILAAVLTETQADLVSMVLRDRGDDRLFERARRQNGGAPKPFELAFDFRALATALAAQPDLVVTGGAVRPLVAAGAAPATLMAVPLRAGPIDLGLVVAAGFNQARPFTEGRRKMLMVLASRAATALENARLHEELKDVFRQTLQGFTQALEASDMYTAGHSDRVSTYAMWIAEGLGMTPEETEFVRQAGLLHDIGKVGVATEALNKPGKLTDVEYETFKSHVTLSKRILDPIRFLKDAVPGAYCHHEKWDGTGYPQGLKGNDIPLLGRIISVADSWDAMTSDRAYRRALPYDVAVGELRKCAGTQFDPKLIEIFIAEVERHRVLGDPVHASQFRPRTSVAERLYEGAGEWAEPEEPAAAS
jgi:putative nucleotidyltransferase with HDIG domain